MQNSETILDKFKQIAKGPMRNDSLQDVKFVRQQALYFNYFYLCTGFIKNFSRTKSI